MSTPTSKVQLLRAFTDYINSVLEEAADRDNDSIRDIEGYFHTRRDNVGARMSYMIPILALDIPDELLYHPAVTELERCVADMLIVDNVSSKHT